MFFKTNISIVVMFTFGLCQSGIAMQEQANIIPKEIHSIDLNPACPYQLAFHLDDGWYVGK